MPTINGTNRADTLIGSAGADTINGRGGNDWLEGGAGNDVLTGGRGQDEFVFRDGFGQDHVTDFRTGDGGDHILIDVNGHYSDVWSFDGQLHDGQTITTAGGAYLELHQGDFNLDGHQDTRVDVYDPSGLQGSIFLDGVVPSDLFAWNFQGG